MMALVQSLLTALRGLAQWWISEIAAMVPERLRRRLARQADRLVLLLGESGATLYLETRQELRMLGEIDLRADAEPQYRVAALLRRHGFAQDNGRAPACLRLAADRVLRTTVDLPMAAESNLGEVVSFELDRHTPFRADQAAFAYRIIERDVGAQRLRVDLTVVPRPLMAEAMAVASGLCLDVTSVEVAERGGSYAASGNLLPDDSLTVAHSGHGILNYGLATTAAVLAVIAFVIHVQSTQQADDAIARERAAAKKSITAVVALQKDIDTLSKEERFLSDRKRERLTVSRLLLDTTHILPDDTWLAEWQLAGSEVQLAGYTASASSLVELLERSKVFKNTTFQSPTVQDGQHGGRERFHFSTRVVDDTP
jgi:general secretion pathway protein L